jgi:protein ImuB
MDEQNRMGRFAMTGELYLCAYARQFPAQALLRLRPELRGKPVAVMEGEVPFQRVCSLNKSARALGAVEGMSRAETDSFPSLILLKRSLPEEQAARLALLDLAGSFSPRVEDLGGDSTFACVLDIAGTEKLFGPPELLAGKLRKSFLDAGVACSIAVSENFHTAVCLARAAGSRAEPILVQPHGERQALSPLPLSVLDVPEELEETFEQWGVSTLGMLAMLPEKDLISRLGQQGKRLRELARGECPHLLVPLDPVPVLEERIEIDMPVEVLDSLLFGVNLMLDQLIARAAARVLSLAVVIAELGLEGGGVHTRIVRPALPTNDKQLWLKLLHLDWVAHPPPAAVISMLLRAETGKATTLQLGLFSPQLPEAGRLDVTLARIRAVVGEGRAGSVELKDSHRPDDFRMKPFAAMSASTSEEQFAPKLTAATMRRFRPPIKVAMTLRNNHPHIFYFGGTAYEVEKSYGPWQAGGGWWSNGHWSIEEWDIIARKRDLAPGNAGQLLCCMTRDVASDRWQVEALYD